MVWDIGGHCRPLFSHCLFLALVLPLRQLFSYLVCHGAEAFGGQSGVPLKHEETVDSFRLLGLMQSDKYGF